MLITLLLCVLYGSQNKQQLLSYTSLTNLECLLGGTDRVLTKHIRFFLKGLMHMAACFKHDIRQSRKHTGHKTSQSTSLSGHE